MFLEASVPEYHGEAHLMIAHQGPELHTEHPEKDLISVLMAISETNPYLR